MKSVVIVFLLSCGAATEPSAEKAGLSLDYVAFQAPNSGVTKVYPPLQKHCRNFQNLELSVCVMLGPPKLTTNDNAFFAEIIVQGGVNFCHSLEKRAAQRV